MTAGGGRQLYYVDACLEPVRLLEFILTWIYFQLCRQIDSPCTLLRIRFIQNIGFDLSGRIASAKATTRRILWYNYNVFILPTDNVQNQKP